MAAASFLTVKVRVVRALLELAEHLGREAESGRIVILHQDQAERYRGTSGLSNSRCAVGPVVPAVYVSVLARVEDDMEAGRRDDDRDDDVLQWAHLHG